MPTSQKTFLSEVAEHLSALAQALTEGQPELWVKEARALRQVCEPRALGKICERCSELEKLDSPAEMNIAALIFESINEEFTRASMETEAT